MTQHRNFQVETDKDGNQVASVFLGLYQKQHCLMYYEDYEAIITLGVSPNWCCTQRGNVVAYNSIDMRPLGIARILLDAGPGEAVRYRDGNPLNLRRENLYLAEDTKAKSRDRDRINPRQSAKQDRKQLDLELLAERYGISLVSENV
jgi:hypothetical protein